MASVPILAGLLVAVTMPGAPQGGPADAARGGGAIDVRPGDTMVRSRVRTADGGVIAGHDALGLEDLFEAGDDVGVPLGQEFRAIPSEIQGIENNLSLANMSFEDFARAVDGDGVFRGFGD